MPTALRTSLIMMNLVRAVPPLPPVLGETGNFSRLTMSLMTSTWVLMVTASISATSLSRRVSSVSVQHDAGHGVDAGHVSPPSGKSEMDWSDSDSSSSLPVPGSDSASLASPGKESSSPSLESP